MTDEQLSVILSALQSIRLAVQDGFEAVLSGPIPATVEAAPIPTEQMQVISEGFYVSQGLEVMLLCFVALVVGVGLGQILARWFR